VKLYIQLFLISILIFSVNKCSGQHSPNTKSSNIVEAPYHIYEFEKLFTVNLSGRGNNQLYAGISLGYPEKQTQLLNELNLRKFQIRTMIELILASKRKSNLDNPEGIKILKEEIRNSINQILKNGKIAEIYFREFKFSK